MRLTEDMEDCGLEEAKASIARWLLSEVGKSAGEQIVGAELGIKCGVHAGFLLDFEPRLFLHCVDLWTEFPPDAGYRAIGDPAGNATQAQYDAWRNDAEWVLSEHPNRYAIHRMSTIDAARLVPDGLDFVYVDADHSYDSRYEDLVEWVPKVKPGGVVAGGLWHSSFGGDACARAVHDYQLQAEMIQPITFGPCHTWMFRKDG